MSGDHPTQRQPRQQVSLLVTLGDGDEPPGRTRNISISGLFLETRRRPPVGEEVSLCFVWGEDTFVTRAQVIWHGDDGLGLKFVEPDTLFLGALAEILGLDALP